MYRVFLPRTLSDDKGQWTAVYIKKLSHMFHNQERRHFSTLHQGNANSNFSQFAAISFPLRFLGYVAWPEASFRKIFPRFLQHLATE